MLGSASTPEAGGREPLSGSLGGAARRDGKRIGPGNGKIALQQPGDDRIPPRRKWSILFHGDEYPSSGRASGDGSGDQHRPGARANQAGRWPTDEVEAERRST